MPYQIIDGVTAHATQADAARTHPLFAWIIMQDLPEYPRAFVARLVTDAPTPYVLLGHTLAEIQASLAARPGALRAPTVRPADCGEDLVSGVAGTFAYAVGTLRFCSLSRGVTWSTCGLEVCARPGARGSDKIT